MHYIVSYSLPRTGGGLPNFMVRPSLAAWFAPHRRGSTVSVAMTRYTDAVCPAQAGVYPQRLAGPKRWMSLPRTGGGLPLRQYRFWQQDGFAPHRRGSTCTSKRQRPVRGVCPAQAGVYPAHGRPLTPKHRLPRTGGGLPTQYISKPKATTFAPHRRGSTEESRMARPIHAVCPAQAGVYPMEILRDARGPGLPRTGGGLPLY